MQSWKTTVKALTVDVFGTATDWHSSIVREGEQLSLHKQIVVDWHRLARAWRSGYEPAMARVRRGELPWTKIDDLHRMILDEILTQHGMPEFSHRERSAFNRVWHRLDPWPDVIGGILRLRTRYTVAALSNANISMLTNMAKYNGIPWDCILSAELARHYKPDKEVYETAAQLLDLEPNAIMMIATHGDDLEGARSVGFKTAFVSRPLEWGENSGIDTTNTDNCDIVARDFQDLADQLAT